MQTKPKGLIWRGRLFGVMGCCNGGQIATIGIGDGRQGILGNDWLDLVSLGAVRGRVDLATLAELHT